VAILAALRAVDWVVPLTDTAALATLAAAARPDVLAVPCGTVLPPMAAGVAVVELPAGRVLE